MKSCFSMFSLSAYFLTDYFNIPPSQPCPPRSPFSISIFHFHFPSSHPLLLLPRCSIIWPGLYFCPIAESAILFYLILLFYFILFIDLFLLPYILSMHTLPFLTPVYYCSTSDQHPFVLVNFHGSYQLDLLSNQHQFAGLDSEALRKDKENIYIL